MCTIVHICPCSYEIRADVYDRAQAEANEVVGSSYATRQSHVLRECRRALGGVAIAHVLRSPCRPAARRRRRRSNPSRRFASSLRAVRSPAGRGGGRAASAGVGQPRPSPTRGCRSPGWSPPPRAAATSPAGSRRRTSTCCRRPRSSGARRRWRARARRCSSLLHEYSHLVIGVNNHVFSFLPSWLSAASFKRQRAIEGLQQEDA